MSIGRAAAAPKLLQHVFQRHNDPNRRPSGRGPQAPASDAASAASSQLDTEGRGDKTHSLLRILAGPLAQPLCSASNLRLAASNIWKPEPCQGPCLRPRCHAAAVVHRLLISVDNCKVTASCLQELLGGHCHVQIWNALLVQIIV